MNDPKKPIDDAERVVVLIKTYWALLQITNGTAARGDACVLGDVVAMVRTLCELNRIRGHVRPYQADQASKGLAEAYRKPDGSMSIDSIEYLNAMRAVVEAYAEALEKFTLGTLNEAREHVVRMEELERAAGFDGKAEV